MVEIKRLQDNLKLIRRTAGWTIEDFAQKIGVTKQTVINFEKNTSTITKTTYIAIRAVLSAEMEKNPEDCKMLYDILDIFVDNPDDYSDELKEVLKSKANIITPATMTGDVSRKDVSREWSEIIIAISAGIGSFALGYALGKTNPNLLKKTIEKMDLTGWTKNIYEVIIMSNLGLYAKITKWSKRCGGPGKFLLLVAGSGYIAFRSIEAGTKKIYREAKEKLDKNIETLENTKETIVYSVKESYLNEYGLSLQTGEKFKVISRDDDVVIISKLEDCNNPYVISFADLIKISDYLDLN